jgi:predicted PurR-regulated permease PerM
MPQSARPDSFGRRVAIVAATVAGLLLLWRAVDVVLLGVGAAVIAALLRAISDPIARHTPLSKGLALIVTILAILALGTAAIWIFGHEIAVQARALEGELPQSWDRVKDWIAGLPFGDKLTSGLGRLSGGQGVISRLTGFVMTFADVATNVVLVLVAGAYLAANPKLYRNGLARLLPAGARPRACATADDMGRQLQRWLLAQAVSMTAVGVLSAIGLWLAGVPSPLMLGLIAGLAEFIPLLGPPLGAVPAVLMGLTAGPQTAGWAILVFVVVQQLESNLITPMVQREVVEIPPLATLFAVTLAGVLFGLLGVVLAGPLTVLVFVAVRDLYLAEGDGGGRDDG